MGKRNVYLALCHEKHELLKVQLQYSILNRNQWLASYYSCFNTKEKIHGTNMIGTRMGPPQVSMDVRDNRDSSCPASQCVVISAPVYCKLNVEVTNQLLQGVRSKAILSNRCMVSSVGQSIYSLQKMTWCCQSSLSGVFGLAYLTSLLWCSILTPTAFRQVTGTRHISP